MAGGSGRGRNAIEPPQNIGAHLPNKRDVERVWQPVCRMPVQRNAIAKPPQQSLPEVIAQCTDALHRREIARQLAGLAEPDGKHDALGARAPAAFMAAAVNKRLERDAAAHVQRPDALRPVEFVAHDRQQIDAELVDAGRNLADGLRSVGVKQHAMLAGNTGTVLDRLDRADFVVGVHDADQDRPRCDRSPKIVGIDTSRSVDREAGDACAKAFEKPARFENRRMLDLRCDNMVALVA
jgi:hypothetical protein